MNKVRAGVPLLLAGMLFGLVVGVAAQDAPWRVVQGSDGALYLLKDGARYAIVGDSIGDDELAAYAEGEAIGTALLLNAIRPAAQAPTARAVTQTAVVDPGPAEPQAAQPAAQTQAVPAAAAGAAKRSASGPTGGPPTTQASADLQFLSVQGNAPGQAVSVNVQAPAGSTCSIEYLTPALARSTAAGLGQQTVGASRTVTWSFLLDSAIRTGTGTVTVTCGEASISRSIDIGGISK